MKWVRIALALLSGWALCGCAALPPRLELPASVVGVVSQPVFTGWFRDYCQGGQLVDSTPDCLQHGGEVYRATLLDVRTESGAPLARRLVIAFPAHALSRAYSGRKRIELVAAPVPFAAATGIDYLAHVWSEP